MFIWENPLVFYSEYNHPDLSQSEYPEKAMKTMSLLLTRAHFPFCKRLTITGMSKV